MKRVLIVMASLLFATNGYAACNASGCDGRGPGSIRSLYPTTKDGKEVVYLEAGSNKEYLNCYLVEDHYITMKSDHPAFRSMYTTVLSAIAMNKRLKVRVKEGTSDCEVAYVRMWN